MATAVNPFAHRFGSPGPIHCQHAALGAASLLFDGSCPWKAQRCSPQSSARPSGAIPRTREGSSERGLQRGQGRGWSRGREGGHVRPGSGPPPQTQPPGALGLSARALLTGGGWGRTTLWLTPSLAPAPPAAPPDVPRGPRGRGRVDTVRGGPHHRCDRGRVPGTWQVPSRGPPGLVLGHDAALPAGAAASGSSALREAACFLFLQLA